MTENSTFTLTEDEALIVMSALWALSDLWARVDPTASSWPSRQTDTAFGRLGVRKPQWRKFMGGEVRLRRWEDAIDDAHKSEIADRIYCRYVVHLDDQ
jgi:hypothetical protein